MSAEDKYNELMSKMSRTKEKWDEEAADAAKAAGDGVVDDEDRLLSEALDLAIEQGRGWGAGEKEAYLEKILDDDFIPPMFATTPEELEKSGLQDAFTSLIYENETPTSLMLQFRKKGNDAFTNGKRNQVKNMQYFRDAVNHYYESLSWADKIEPMLAGDLAQADTDDPTYTPDELKQVKSTICSNIALMHVQLKNWGLARDECRTALEYDSNNVKAWFRLATACKNLTRWEEAGDAIDAGLAANPSNVDLKRLQKQLEERVAKARKQRQQRERARAERTLRVKQVWKHCKSRSIRLGRVSLVNAANEDDVDGDGGDDVEESRWHQHLPHSGHLPAKTGSAADDESGWSWPCMFLYPSHHQSDFVASLPEGQMLAVMMAEMFPELDDDNNMETSIAWDHDNEFVCSNLAVYFEVHTAANSDVKNDASSQSALVHPDQVEVLRDQAACIRFYEACRALKGDEGADLADVVRAIERRRLGKQQRAWKQKHGNLWSNRPDRVPVVRVHPAVTLAEVLSDPRMVVPNVSEAPLIVESMRMRWSAPSHVLLSLSSIVTDSS